jgi:archaellum component FlaC
MPDPQFIDIGQRLSVTETHTSAHEKHLDRIDASLEKLTEVSISLREIVKHQDHAIKNVKLAGDAVALKLIDLEKKLEEDLDGVKVELQDSIEAVKETLEQSTSFLDKWKWVVIGAGGVAFLILDHWEFFKALFAVG